MLKFFSLCSVVWWRFFLRDKHKYCGVCGRGDISGYCRRGFGERAFFLVQREGCKDAEFKDTNCEKVETFKIIFLIRTFPSVCTAPASQHRRSDSHPFRTKL